MQFSIFNNTRSSKIVMGFISTALCLGLILTTSGQSYRSKFEAKTSDKISSTALTSKDAIRPFRVNVPEKELIDLRRRLAETRWPSKELVADRSQGVQLATLKELARYWATEYDWRKAEAKLNALPQFVTQIDGVDIHFIHVRSPHENALPLIMTRGWPGSVIELLETVGPAAAGAGGGAPPPVKVPVGFTTFPGEVFAAPRSWVETVYPGLAYFNVVDRGGHFAAWEEPALFASELRSAFKSLR